MCRWLFQTSLGDWRERGGERAAVALSTAQSYPATRLERSWAGEDLGSWWAPGWPGAHSVTLDCFRQNIASRSREGVLPRCSALVGPHLDHCIQFQPPQYKRGVNTLCRAQRRAAKMVEKLELFPGGDRLRELGLLSLEQRRLQGILPM